MGRLDGKVALISGGARGQGAVEARQTQLHIRHAADVSICLGSTREILHYIITIY